MQNIIKTLFILFLPVSVFGQINFYRQYSNNGSDFGEGLIQLEDSSYVLCGSSSSFTNHAQAFLLKVDSLGNYIWSNNYGGFEHESARRVMYKKNFGFFIAGYTNSSGAGSYDFYLGKVDESGILEWDRTYGGSGWDRVLDAKMTRDTGVVMVGELSTPSGNKDWYVVKTDKNGDTLWTKNFGREGNDFAKSVEIYQDSLIIIGGTVANQDSLQNKAMIVYMSDNGIILDSLEIGPSGNYELNDITMFNDTIRGVGNYKLVDSNSYSLSYYQVRANVSTLQEIITTNDVFSVGDNYGQLMTSYNNGLGRYVSMGRENQASVVGPGQDIFVAQYEPNWMANACYMTGSYDDIGGEFIPTSDGGAAMAGWRGAIGPGEGTVFLLKIGPNSVYPVTSGITYVDDLVTIEEKNEIEGVNIFPNPATYNLTLDLEKQGEYSLTITNLLGQIVYEDQIFGSTIIDVSLLEAGNYFLKISTDTNQTTTYKILKR